MIGYRFLSLFLVFLTFNFTDEALRIGDTYIKHPLLMLIFQPSTYAIAPSFYLASVYLTSVDKRLNLKVVRHFIPYFLLLALCILASQIPQDLITANKPKSNQTEKVAGIFLAALLYIQIFWYLFSTVGQLRKHRQSIPLYLSSFTGNDYRWISQIVASLGLLSVIWLLETIAGTPIFSLYTSIIYLCAFYYIGVQIMQQKDILSFSTEENENDVDSSNYQQTGTSDSTTYSSGSDLNSLKKKLLSDEKVDQLKDQLLVLMKTDKPYLDSEITLPKLSKMMLSNTYHMSYLLNVCLEENFYTFINRYRIEECMQLLRNPDYDQLTILGIAFECGFNSKTSFNTSFKKITGLSPKEFKEQRDRKME